MEEDKETQDMINSIKTRVADVIINLNLIESLLSDIVASYINSPKNEFVRHLLLSSLVVSFSSKLNLLRYILNQEKIDHDKNLFNSIKVIMTKRNVVAHSESLLNIEAEVVDLDFDWNPDGVLVFPIYGPAEPNLPVINNGQIDYENISKIIADFSKHFENAKKGLELIQAKLSQGV